MNEWGLISQDSVAGVGNSATINKFYQGVAMCETRG